jgi:hypothetical protein
MHDVYELIDLSKTSYILKHHFPPTNVKLCAIIVYKQLLCNSDRGFMQNKEKLSVVLSHTPKNESVKR